MVAPKRGDWSVINTKRIGSVIFAINNFLSKLSIEKRIKNDWQAEMNTLLYPPVDIPRFYEVMGLLDNWKESPLWKEGV
jgi:abortive infection bacteriophage resistance protein